MSKRSVNFSGMGGKHGRYANSVQGLVDAMHAVGMTDAEIKAELIKIKAEREAGQAKPDNPDDGHQFNPVLRDPEFGAYPDERD